MSLLARFSTGLVYLLSGLLPGRRAGPMFVPERNLKDLVVSYIRERERSISALTKQLKQDGYAFHRLFVTGYLKALSDLGVLREKDIPPAKVYTPAAPREERDEARRGLVKVGLQLPTNEPAYAVPERRNEFRDEILRELIVDRFGMGTLVLETKQMKLTER